MGVIIYVSGELTTEKALTAEQQDAVLAIQDGWGYEAFRLNGNSIEVEEEMEGADPIEDGLLTPIRQLVDYLKREQIPVEGALDVTSDWSDYDNITFIVKDWTVTTANSQIYYADDRELIEELKSRGYIVTKKRFQLLSTNRDDLDICVSYHETRQEAVSEMIENIKDACGYESFEAIEADPNTAFSDKEAWAETEHFGTGYWMIEELPSE